MLREIRRVRQVEGEAHRRWFSSSRLDLFVWYGASEAPVGFQLCYDKDGWERALTWNAPDRFSHEVVDDGEGRLALPFPHKFHESSWGCRRA